jgi:replicative DNA helicase
MHGEDFIPRQPPYSAEAEQSVLGSLLLDNAHFDAVAAVVGADDFHDPQHRAIWGTVARLVGASKLADVITVHDAGQHDLRYCNDLAQSVPTARHAVHYARIVRERSVLRQLIRIGDDLASAAYRTHDKLADAGTLADAAIVQLLKLVATGKASSDPQVLAALIPPFLDALDARSRGENDAIPTGLTDLDRALAGGPRRGELIVIGGRPSMGKSALTLTIARKMAAFVPVLVLSMEDSRHMLVARQMAAAGRVNLADIRSPQHAPDSMWTGVADAAEALSPLPLHIDDSPALTLRDVERKVAQVRHKAPKLGVVIIDYLQLMKGAGENRHQVLGAIAAGCKEMAKNMDVAVFLLSQLNREADKTNEPPRLDHLRESGGIEEAADVVGLLWREHRRKPTPENKRRAQLELAKNKNGATDTIKLWFDGATQRFADALPGDNYGQ